NRLWVSQNSENMSNFCSGIQQQCSHSGMDQLSETAGKVEQKPQKPGKYVCDYCGRACAKPSVLKKHIRSHTGERPYPCIPCGFSFKTKSNLYKHRKSHAHSVKAGTNILSHLPLHSQQQAHSLLPVVPVGGLQMLHSPPSSSTDVSPSSAPSPQSSEGQRCSSREGSVHGPETGGDDIGGPNQLSCHPAAQEKSLEPGVGDSRQEENVQTCLKAIASLKITTEDPH
uniref:C2H2-type domain-containing protein n=1 Tax=Stegastes partitus TaxID=144197 RepID=A0A3B5AL27_9TELE